jgi:hypothetical protein
MRSSAPGAKVRVIPEGESWPVKEVKSILKEGKVSDRLLAGASGTARTVKNPYAALRFLVRAAFLADRDRSVAGRLAAAAPPSRPPLWDGE